MNKILRNILPFHRKINLEKCLIKPDNLTVFKNPDGRIVNKLS